MIVHEVPLEVPVGLGALKGLSDKGLTEGCKEMFARELCEDEGKWEALGKDFHNRIEGNYATWVRNYVGKVERGFSKEELSRRPVTWTIGGLTPAGKFWGR